MFASYPRIKSSLLKHAIVTLPSTPTLCQEAIGYMGFYLFSYDIYISIILLGNNMRQKMITLCPTTYEMASNMKNFSAWIRQELMKKQATEYKAKPESIQEHQKYGAYCDSCDVTFLDTDPALLKGRMPCKKCGKGTTYLGLIE